MQLALANFINISVSQAQAGVGNFNTSNIGLFSTEDAAETFGTAGFKAYIDPTDVGTDFGTSSRTYQMAVAIFSQQPNILAGGGQLIVILLGHATTTLTFGGVAASGTFEVTYKGNSSVAINWNDTASEIQAKLQAVPGLDSIKVTGTISGESLVLDDSGIYGANPTITISNNTLATGGSSAVSITPSTTTAGETLSAAITRTAGLVQYFGILITATADEMGQTDVLAAAGTVQALVKMFFIPTFTESLIQEGGTLYLVMTGLFTQTRGLYYGDNTDYGINAMLFAAAYAGFGLSVDFTGSNTTITMNFKGLNTIQPDPSMTQTIYNEAQAAGTDIYASIQGVPKCVSFGANNFFDQVYNLLAFVAGLQVAGFNYLAEASTKIPQTENGMDGLKGAYRNVCEEFVTNEYLAPGTWTSPTTFGNQNDLYLNIAQRGYYIYSQPVGQQSQTNRAARQAPLVQIAIKQAGAIQSSNIIVNVNA